MDDPMEQVGRCLVSCLRMAADGPSSSTRTPVDLGRPPPQALLAGARAHRISPFVLDALRASDVDNPTLEAGLLEDQRILASAQLRTALDLSTLGDVLDREGVPWLVFKGPVLAHLAYRRPGRRRYDDLDVLTPPAAFPSAVRALEAAGFVVLDQNWHLIRREGRGQLHLIHPDGGMVDLHWHLLNRAGVRGGFSLDIDGVFERSRATHIDGMPIRTLDPVDMLVHTCLHAAMSGAGRLLWVRDVEGLVSRLAEPWDAVEGRARSWRAAAPVGLMLERARRILGAEVPTGLTHRLFGSRLRARIDRLIDRGWPLEMTTAQMSPATVWAEVQRDGVSRLIMAATRRGARRPLALVQGRRHATGAIMLPTGTQGDREAFLRDVEMATL